MALLDNKNRILAKISVAARTALTHPRNVELAHLIGAGPSIRARARLALAAAFLVATPTLFIGVMRTETVAEHATSLSEYDDYWKLILQTKLALKELDLALWIYTSEREVENGQAALVTSKKFKDQIEKVVVQKPMDLNLGPAGFFESLTRRLDGVIKRSINNKSSVASARLNIITLSKELESVERRVRETAKLERNEALGALAAVGRDQLILFLVLLFAIPVFVGFVPGWLVAPLRRLKQISAKLEDGKIRDIAISGRDEVAELARLLKTYFIKREDLDQKKSSKVFEMRNLLRSVINRVQEPVIIVDSKIRINYTNEAASTLVGLPSHQMEGTYLTDCMYSPVAKKAVEKAFAGDSSENAIPLTIEVADGREFAMQAKIGLVRNRDGEVSRAVLVLYSNDILEKEFT